MSEQVAFPEVLLRMFTFQAWQPDPASLVIAQAEAALQAGFESPSLYLLVGPERFYPGVESRIFLAMAKENPALASAARSR